MHINIPGSFVRVAALVMFCFAGVAAFGDQTPDGHDIVTGIIQLECDDQSYFVASNSHSSIGISLDLDSALAQAINTNALWFACMDAEDCEIGCTKKRTWVTDSAGAVDLDIDVNPSFWDTNQDPVTGEWTASLQIPAGYHIHGGCTRCRVAL